MNNTMMSYQPEYPEKEDENIEHQCMSDQISEYPQFR